MNLENIEQNEPFTQQILQILSDSKSCYQQVVDSEFLDTEDAVTVIERIKIINSRSILLLSCLYSKEMAPMISEINREEQIEFLGASEIFLRDVRKILEAA